MATARNWFWKFYFSFHESETILWARAQWVFLCLYTGMQTADMSIFISDKKLLQLYMITNAIVGEALRRRRAEYDDAGRMR